MRIIELRDVHKVYTMGTEKVHALNGVSLEMERGEYVAIMGSSGSGKSTLMNLIGCLDTPSSGSYHLNGVAVEELDDTELAASATRDRLRLPVLPPAAAHQRPPERRAAAHLRRHSAFDAEGTGRAAPSNASASATAWATSRTSFPAASASASRVAARPGQRSVDPARRRADRQPRLHHLGRDHAALRRAAPGRQHGDPGHP